MWAFKVGFSEIGKAACTSLRFASYTSSDISVLVTVVSRPGPVGSPFFLAKGFGGISIYNV